MNSPEEVASQWLSLVKDAYLLGDAATTESLLMQALDETNDAPELMEIAGVFAFRRGDYQKAVHQIGEAMLEISLTVTGQLTLAESWIQLGQFNEAETTLSFLVEIINRVPCSLLPNLAHLLADLKKYELAIEVCRKGFERHPDDDNAIFGVAFYMHRAGYPLELVHGVMTKAVELQPGSSLYRLNLASVCCSLAKWEDAYDHASALPDAAIRSISCRCMYLKLYDVFMRLEDSHRLNLLNCSPAAVG